MTAELEAKRARLAVVEHELAGLGARHDLAMSAFKWEEAQKAQERITVLERERAELAAALPTQAPPPAAPMPVAIRPRRPIRRRCGIQHLSRRVASAAPCANASRSAQAMSG